MARKIKQFRFWGDNAPDGLNNPYGLKSKHLTGEPLTEEESQKIIDSDEELRQKKNAELQALNPSTYATQEEYNKAVLLIEQKYNALIGADYTIPSKIVQLGIQGPPGLKFTLNNGETLIIGLNGFYELNVDGYAYIENLTFDADMLKEFDTYQGGVLLLIDLVYEED